MSKTRYATVALPLPFKYHSGGTEGLTYQIPEELLDRAQVGVRVLVPLGRLERTGVLVATSHQAPAIDQKIRPLVDVLDKVPVFDERFLAWTKWIAEYYLTSWGEVLAAALPEGLKPETKARVVLTQPSFDILASDLQARKSRRSEVLRVLGRHKNAISISQLQRETKSKSLYAVLHTLEEQEIIRIERPLVRHSQEKKETVAMLGQGYAVGSEALSEALTSLERSAPKQANILLTLIQQQQQAPDDELPVKLLLAKAGSLQSSLRALRERGLVALGTKAIPAALGAPFRQLPGEHDISTLTLTQEQKHAVERISEKIHLAEHRTFLLHGVTGSGKTEVYVALAKKVLSENGGVLILVPEIALTPQLIDRFKARLSIEDDREIAVLHSRMSTAERSAAWHSLANGTTRLAIGARSAVFAPVHRLRLIIVDEEHESTFKQYDTTPRYHARDAAIVRAAMMKGVAVLGSATPSIESYYNAIEGKYDLITIKERAKRAAMPVVKIVDLRTAQSRAGTERSKMALTPELSKAIETRLERKEGVVLFQNRRGFSTYIECHHCGTAEMCPNCAVTMTYHQSASQMRCHYCGYVAPKRATCAVCGSEDLRLGGLGTQRVEEDIKLAFPYAKIERMDLDTTGRKGAFRSILTRFANGETDILLGTQMVAKGLDFPRVTLVGVISADTSLCLPDFRSGERTFQLLSQVSGRAGRSEELPGEVLIQTLQPQNETIQFAASHNYEAFFQKELQDRGKLLYPPFSRLILIEFRGVHESAVKQSAFAFSTLFPERASFYERIGPAPPSIPRLRNEFRWHILIKNLKKIDPNGEKIRRLITGALDQYQKRYASRQVRVTVDVDVQGVL